MLRQDFISTLQEEATLEECSEALAAAVLWSWLSLSLVLSISYFFFFGFRAQLEGLILIYKSFLRLGPHYLDDSVFTHSTAILMHKGNPLIELYMISNQHCVFK